MAKMRRRPVMLGLRVPMKRRRVQEESSAGEGSESEEEAAAPAADGGEMGPDYKKKWKKAMFK